MKYEISDESSDSFSIEAFEKMQEKIPAEVWKERKFVVLASGTIEDLNKLLEDDK